MSPTGSDVRPTGDRVREATFNSLGSMDALIEARALDLFGGSGALGIEALSRGAGHCTFVDSSRRSIEAIRENLRGCGFDDRSTVLRLDALDFLARNDEDFDLALLDPPYAFDSWEALLGSLHSSVVVIESDREIDPGPGLVVQRRRRYGSTVVTIATENRTVTTAADEPLEDRP